MSTITEFDRRVGQLMVRHHLSRQAATTKALYEAVALLPANVVDSTATEQPLTFERPIRVSRPTFDVSGVGLMLALLVVLVLFAGLIVNITAA